VNPPTQLQRDTLLDMVCHFGRWGEWPSTAQLAATAGVSKNTARDRLRALRDKGFVEQNNGSWRAVAWRKFAATYAAAVLKELESLPCRPPKRTRRPSATS
jgi:DNA-binding transcriptional regulator YhcF (GntR family)